MFEVIRVRRGTVKLPLALRGILLRVVGGFIEGGKKQSLLITLCTSRTEAFLISILTKCFLMYC